MDDKFGFINYDGEITVPPKYDSIDNYNVYKKDLAVVKLAGKYGLINIDGIETLAPQYDSLAPLDQTKE